MPVARVTRCLGHLCFILQPRNLLTEEEVSMCLWLASGWPPQMKVRDIRASNRGQLKLGQRWNLTRGLTILVYSWLISKFVLVYLTAWGALWEVVYCATTNLLIRIYISYIIIYSLDCFIFSLNTHLKAEYIITWLGLHGLDAGNPRRDKFLEARDRQVTMNNGVNRLAEIRQDYKNLDHCIIWHLFAMPNACSEEVL